MRKVYADECARLRRHAQKYHNCSLFGTKFKMASQLSGIEIRQRDLDAKIKNPWLTKWEEEEVEISWLDTSSKKDEEKRATRIAESESWDRDWGQERGPCRGSLLLFVLRLCCLCRLRQESLQAAHDQQKACEQGQGECRTPQHCIIC